jgi:hypothetical protein
LSSAARELLTLEEMYQRGQEFDDNQAQRWHELVATVFGQNNSAHHRRSLRLPALVPVIVQIRKGLFQCHLSEVSRLGVALGGEVFKHITHEDSIVLRAITVERAEEHFELKYHIENIRLDREPPVCGATISNENSPESRGHFFDKVFYPLYLCSTCVISQPAKLLS